MWRIWYCNCWYHFDKHPGRIYSVMCLLLLLQEGASALRIMFLQEIYLRWVIIICLFILSLDTPAEVHLLLLHFDIQQIRYFIMFYLSSSQNFAYLKNLEEIPLWYFKHNFWLQTSKSTTFQNLRINPHSKHFFLFYFFRSGHQGPKAY